MPIARQRVDDLVRQLSAATGYGLPRRADHGDLAALERRIGIALPEELADWLQCCNGSDLGPGGLFGVRPDDPELDIGTQFEWFPEWREARWIPVASDGCGSYYVLDARGTKTGMRPIYFLDHEDRPSPIPSYVAASGLWTFLWLLLRKEHIGDDPDASRWPFDKAFVVADDPDVLDYDGPAPLPWLAE